MVHRKCHKIDIFMHVLWIVVSMRYAAWQVMSLFTSIYEHIFYTTGFSQPQPHCHLDCQPHWIPRENYLSCMDIHHHPVASLFKTFFLHNNNPFCVVNQLNPLVNDSVMSTLSIAVFKFPVNCNCQSLTTAHYKKYRGGSCTYKPNLQY